MYMKLIIHNIFTFNYHIFVLWMEKRKKKILFGKPPEVSS